MSERFVRSYSGFDTQEAAESWVSERENELEKLTEGKMFVIKSKVSVDQTTGKFVGSVIAESV